MPTKDYVDRLIHEKVGAIKNDLDDFSNRMDDHCSKAVHEIQTLKGEAEQENLGAKYNTLKDQLNKYAEQIKKTFQHVERVEQDFHNHVGQAFDTLAAETVELRKRVDGLKSSAPDPGPASGAQPSAGPGTFNSPNCFSGGTSPPAGAHNGKGPANGETPLCQDCKDECHCHHVQFLWKEHFKAQGGGGHAVNTGSGGGGAAATSAGELGGSQPCPRCHRDRLADRVALAERKLELIGNADFWRPRRDPQPPGKQDFHGGAHGRDGDDAPGDGPGGVPAGVGGDPEDVRGYDEALGIPVTPIENIEKLFDDKIAISEGFQYAGGDGGDKWRTKLRGHWISRCPVLLPMLNWAEKHDAASVKEATWRQKVWRGRRISDEQVTRLSELIWGS